MIKLNELSLGINAWMNIAKVLRTGYLVSGPFVKKFESGFSEFVEKADCIAVNSGTSALHLMLLAAGVGPGDEIIVPSFSFAASANAVALTGAKPVFADIELDYYCINTKEIESLITSKTKGIMVVHLYGHPANMEVIQKVAEQNALMIFEDAAQAHDAQINGKPVGTFGLAGAFSFYATKNITSGEGGIVTTKDENLARKVRLLRNQGMERRYENEIVGFNNRLSDLHAAIGTAQLQKLLSNTRKRIKNAQYYDRHLNNVIIPKTMPGARHVYHQYTIRVKDRDEVMSALKNSGIEVGIYYPSGIHKLESFNLKNKLPNTDLMASECLSLPIHPGLKKRHLRFIVKTLNSITEVEG
jgi:dTDP-4-amino-4,6-dideoxygalactose transaminase